MRVEVKVPQLPESVAEATLVSWHRKVGEAVARDENLIDVETDKVVLELPAPEAGVLVEILKADGATVAGQEVVAVIDTDGDGDGWRAGPRRNRRQRHRRRRPRPRGRSGIAGGAAAALPRARCMAEQGMTAADVQGTGRGGRVTKGDVLGAASARAAAPAAARGRVGHARRRRRAAGAGCARRCISPAGLGQRPEQRVPMSRLRQRVAERLVQSQSTAAILTTFNEVNMQPVIDLRNRYKDRFEKEHGVKLGFMGFFVKAAVHALKKFPVVNASIDGTRHRLPRLFRHRHRGGQPARPRRADHPRRRPAVDRRDRGEDRRFRQAGAGRQAHRRRAHRRHVHDQQRRRVRLDAVDADHQSAAVGDPRRPRDQGPRRSSRTGRSSCAR